jgi:predicted alpha/beta hydrolase
VVGVVASTLGVFPGEALGFGGLQGRTLMVEWSRAARSGSWGELEAGVATEPLEVLAVTVEGDTWVPPAATRALVAKLSGARVRWEHLPIPGEPARLRPHFRWMRAPAELAERVVAFLAMR